MHDLKKTMLACHLMEYEVKLNCLSNVSIFQNYLYHHNKILQMSNNNLLAQHIDLLLQDLPAGRQVVMYVFQFLNK
jgi:hypothetical protein